MGCSFKKKVILRWPKVICVSRRCQVACSALPVEAAPAWGCFGLFCCFGWFGRRCSGAACSDSCSGYPRLLRLSLAGKHRKCGCNKCWRLFHEETCTAYEFWRWFFFTSRSEKNGLHICTDKNCLRSVSLFFPTTPAKRNCLQICSERIFAWDLSAYFLLHY